MAYLLISTYNRRQSDCKESIDELLFDCVRQDNLEGRYQRHQSQLNSISYLISGVVPKYSPFTLREKMNAITVEPLESQLYIKEIEEIQRLTWGTEDSEILPAHLLSAFAYNNKGGLIGAFDRSKLVGYVCGVLGTFSDPKNDEKTPKVAASRLQIYSVSMGVLPEYQGQGIGYQLKLAQRRHAISLGIRLVSWLFDPLESRNAWLNIAKLGGVCQVYLPDFHGEYGGINAALDTDRLHLEWRIDSRRMKRRLQEGHRPLDIDLVMESGVELVNESTIETENPIPPDSFRRTRYSALVEIPSDIQAVKVTDLTLAKRWRQHIRQVFDYYFSQSYLITDFIRHKDKAGHQHSYYLLIPTTT